MPNDPYYYAAVRLAGAHLQRAWDGFQEDQLIPWRELRGNAPKVRAQVWVDALKEALAHNEQLERKLS